ncbi:hypothetical protein RFI_04876, partial [Reticulomyxa filosa]
MQDKGDKGMQTIKKKKKKKKKESEQNLSVQNDITMFRKEDAIKFFGQKSEFRILSHPNLRSDFFSRIYKEGDATGDFVDDLVEGFVDDIADDIAEGFVDDIANGIVDDIADDITDDIAEGF